MSNIVSYKLTDEIADVRIPSGYDPIQDHNFEEYIHISEKSNLGKKDFFNNITKKETIDLHISGLFLNWSSGMSKKLESLLTTGSTILNKRSVNKFTGRDNIENLYMYADTVRIDSYLHMPQTNVFIYARRLIMGEDGILDTTPLPFANPNATGGTEEDGMAHGFNANDAGNINIFADDIKFNKRRSIEFNKKIVLSSPPNIQVPPPAGTKTFGQVDKQVKYLVKPIFSEDFSMLKGSFEFVLDAKDKGEVYFVFTDSIPSDGTVDLTKTRNLKFMVTTQKQKETFLRIKIDVNANGKVYFPAGYEGNFTLSGPELKPDTIKYIGVYINKNIYREVPIKEINYRIYDPYFILNGADGQHGQEGNRKTRTLSEDVPVSFDKLKEEVISFDNVRGKEENWIWGGKHYLRQSQVYYSEYIIYSPANGSEADKCIKRKVAGNKTIENMDNGLDAYKSGDGGSGGNGGILSVWNKTDISKYYTVNSGGKKGISKLKKGTAKKKDSEVYHVNYYIRHAGIAFPTFLNELKKALRYNGFSDSFTWEASAKIEHDHMITKTLKSRDGKDAKGNDGENGKAGSIKQFKEYYRWLHPNVLESIINYCKDTFLTGDRRPARWLLSIYLDLIKELKYTPEDFLTRNLINELSVINNKVSKNLDYFGNPVGWIPRLSALSNIDIMKNSKSSIVNVLYYAQKLNLENEASENREEQLAFMVNQLKQENETARQNLQDGYDMLDSVKIEMDEINKKVKEHMDDIRDLKQRLETQLKDEAQQHAFEQAIFSGIFEIAGAICQVIPYGQPFLGSIGGAITEKIANIDIHGENLLSEAMKTTGEIATDLGSYVNDNKDKITKKVTSGINKDIKNTEREIGEIEKGIKSHKEDLEIYYKILGNDIGVFNSKLKLANYQEGAEDILLDYIDNPNILDDHFDRLEMSVDEQNETFLGILNLKDEKTDLVERLKEHNKTKKKQTKQIEKAGNILEGVGKGIASISNSIITMTTPKEVTDEKFNEALEKITNVEIKKEFEKLKEELDVFTAEKLKTAQKLFKLENIIESSCQTISSNLVKISAFNDERASIGQRQLNILTKQFLNRVSKETQELLLAQIYYLLRSYQYKFVSKIKTNLYDIPKLLKEINDFFTENGTKVPTKKDFENAFDFVIQSEFLSLALVLLTTKIQNLPSGGGAHYSIKFNEESKTKDGVSVLKELNKNKSIKFKFHELGIDSAGSGKDFYYRIKDIKFNNIKVSFPQDVLNKNKDIKNRLSFKFGIKHSGESVIRAADGSYYFFTSKGPESDTNIIQNIKSWDAIYNGDKRKDENHGIDNEKNISDDHAIVSKLLSEISKGDNKLEYGEHLPGATSELTLSIYENNIPVNFEITELGFDFSYEGISGNKSALKSANRSNNSYLEEQLGEKKDEVQKLIKNDK